MPKIIDLTVHFKRNSFAKTGCGKSGSFETNINWDKVNCMECLMLKSHLKNKRK